MLLIGVLVVVAILPTIANNTQLMTSKISKTNETISFAACRTGGHANPTMNETSSTCNFTVAQVPDGWRDSDGGISCGLTNFVMRNWTGDTMTSGTDYVVTLGDGIVNLRNTTDLGMEIDDIQWNESYVDYDFCDEGYVNSSGGRSVAGLILIFAALGLIGFVIYYSVTKLGLMAR